MGRLLKSILGNGANREALATELKSLLGEINTSRGALVAMVQHADASKADLAKTSAPLAEVQTDLSSVQDRAQELGAAIVRLNEVANRVDDIEEQAHNADAAQRAVETRLEHASRDADRVRSEMDSLWKWAAR